MKPINLLLVALIIISLSGCSKGKHDPITAGTLPDSTTIIYQGDFLPVIAFDGSSAIGVLGYYEMSIMQDGADVSLLPGRSTLIGESYIVSGDAFFTTTPCRDCLRIDRIGMDSEENIIVGFTIKHPFEKGNPGEPPSNTNRLDLDIFDVALVLNPINSTPTNFELTEADIYSGIVLNADGYTTELASLLNNTAARPYKICYLNPENNRFEMGTDWQSFEVLIAGGYTQFELFVTMGYGASAERLDRLNPQYYVQSSIGRQHGK